MLIGNVNYIHNGKQISPLNNSLIGLESDLIDKKELLLHQENRYLIDEFYIDVVKALIEINLKR